VFKPNLNRLRDIPYAIALARDCAGSDQVVASNRNAPCQRHSFGFSARGHRGRPKDDARSSEQHAMRAQASGIDGITPKFDDEIPFAPGWQ